MQDLAAAEYAKAEKLNNQIEKKTIEYVAWFMDEITGGGDMDGTMQTVVSHTNQWAEANVLVNLIEQMNSHYSEAIKHRHGRKQPDPRKQQMLIRVAMAKALHEVYGTSGNATSDSCTTTIGFTANAKTAEDK